MSSVPIWFEVVVCVAAGALLATVAALLELYWRLRRNRGLLGNPHHWNGSDGEDRTRRDRGVHSVVDDGG
jgi:hypothetical protein